MDRHIDQGPELSIVVLGYRSGYSLIKFISELIYLIDRNKIDYQIVLVGNYWLGYEDITVEIIKKLAKNNWRIKPVIKPKKGMMGWDMKSGLEAANGNYIAVIDGDGQMPAKDVVRVYNKLKNDNLDFVKTYRQKRFDNLWRRIISFFYNLSFKALFPGFRIRDVNSKPKIFTRNLYNKFNLVSDDWFIDAEIMIQVRRYRVRLGEIPTVFNQIKERPSFVKFGAIFEFIKNLIIARIREYKK